MKTNTFRRIAVELAAQGAETPFAVIIASSRGEADCFPAAKGVAEGFAAIGMDAAAYDAADGGLQKLLAETGGEKEGPFSPAGAAAFLETLKGKHPVSVLAVSCPRTSDTALMLIGAAGRTALLERKKLSRTDEIDRALEAVRDAGGRPAGFILE